MFGCILCVMVINNKMYLRFFTKVNDNLLERFDNIINRMIGLTIFFIITFHWDGNYYQIQAYMYGMNICC
jgi:hypothetical protein